MGHKVAPPSQPAGGAEGNSGGTVPILSIPPLPSYSDNHPVTTAELCLTLDQLLDQQERYAKAVKRLRTAWIISVCALTALNAIAWLWERIYG